MITYIVVGVNVPIHREFPKFMQAFAFLKRAGFETVLTRYDGKQYTPLLSWSVFQGVQLMR